jgi:hypothetical protein
MEQEDVAAQTLIKEHPVSSSRISIPASEIVCLLEGGVNDVPGLCGECG